MKSLSWAQLEVRMSETEGLKYKLFQRPVTAWARGGRDSGFGKQHPLHCSTLWGVNWLQDMAGFVLEAIRLSRGRRLAELSGRPAVWRSLAVEAGPCRLLFWVPTWTFLDAVVLQGRWPPDMMFSLGGSCPSMGHDSWGSLLQVHLMAISQGTNQSQEHWVRIISNNLDSKDPPIALF